MTRRRSLVRRGAVVGTALAFGASLLGPAGVAGGATTPQTTDARAFEGARLTTDDTLRYRSKRDPRGDIARSGRNSAIDIKRLQGWPHTNNKPRYAAVRITGYDFPRVSSRRNIADVYINRRGTGPKPDYRVVKYLPRDGDGLAGAFVLKVRGWNRTVDRVHCPGLVVPFNPRRDRITFFIPRACINVRHGRKFQIHGRIWNVYRYTSDGDPAEGWFDEVPNRLRRAEPRFLRGWV